MREYIIADLIVKLNNLRVEGHISITPYEMLVYFNMLDWLDEMMDDLVCDVICDIGKERK